MDLGHNPQEEGAGPHNILDLPPSIRYCRCGSQPRPPRRGTWALCHPRSVIVAMNLVHGQRICKRHGGGRSRHKGSHRGGRSCHTMSPAPQRAGGGGRVSLVAAARTESLLGRVLGGATMAEGEEGASEGPTEVSGWVSGVG